MQHQSPSEFSHHRVRSADRSDIVVPCTVIRIDEGEFEGEVRNLSPGGALLASKEPLPANSFISLRFGDWEPVSAQVKWSDGEQCGCRFVRTLTVRQYLRLRQGDAFEAPLPEKTGLLGKIRRLLPGKAA
jgi:hypothetical protein